ncbi:MAG: helix-turn-helix transcriptional regulator [Microbacteriaceae bacterium]
MRRRLDHGAALARIVELAEAPREGALVVVGEPGIGKTQLLEEACQALGGSVVLVRANPAERGFPLSGFSAIAAAVNDRRAVEFGGRFSLRSAEQGQLFAAAHDVLGMLRGLRLPSTVVLVDDADALDDDSRRLLGLMAERLAGTGLRLVLAAQEVAPRSPFGGSEVVELAALDPEAAMELGRVTTEVDDGTLRLLARLSAGNPTELREQLLGADRDELAGRTGLLLPLQPKTELALAAQRTLARLQPDERRALDDIALAPQLHLGVLGGAPGGQNASAPDALDDLMSDGLLLVRAGTVRVRDPRLRAHLFWSMSGRARRQRHHALAVLHEPLDDRLAVWHRSQEQADAAAGEELLRAAVAFAEEGDGDVAMEFAERAVRLAVPHGRSDPLLVSLAERLVLHGDFEAANRYLGFARLDAASPAETTRAAMVRVGAGALAGTPLGDGEVAAIAMVHGAQAPDGSVALLAAAAALRAEQWELGASRTLLAQAGAISEPLAPPTRSLLHAVETMVEAHDGRSPGAVAALDSTLLQRPTLALLQARSLIWGEEHASARLLLASLMAFPRSGEPLWSDAARVLSIDNEIAAGDYRTARLLIEAPFTVRTDPGSALQALLAAWHRVSLDEADADGAEPQLLLEESMHRALRESNPALQARTAALHAGFALLRDDPEETLRQGLVLGRLRRLGGPEHQLRHVGDSIEAALRLGLTARANEEIAAFRQRHARRPSRWGRQLLLRLRAQTSSGAASVPLFQSAVEAFEPGDSPYELGRTQLAFAERLGQLGMADDERMVRAAAVAAFDGAGAVGWSARAAGGASDPIAAPIEVRLTGEEIEIVRLVQRGARNREIADALFLSVRTVEQRLTRIYRTLGIASRAQLGSALASTAMRGIGA